MRISFDLDLGLWGTWEPIVDWVVLISKNKTFSYECEWVGILSLISFSFTWRWRQDHAGVDLQFTLLGLSHTVQFYDNRHWDYETNNWVVYDVKEE